MGKHSIEILVTYDERSSECTLSVVERGPGLDYPMQSAESSDRWSVYSAARDVLLEWTERRMGVGS